MSLQVWLPLNGNLNNQGVSNVTYSTPSGISYVNGKFPKCPSISSNTTINYTVPNLETMLANGKTYSLSCWVKPTNSVANGWVVKFGSNNCGLWWCNSEARWVWNENDNGKRCANPTISGDYTNWHHLVTTVDKTVTNQITAKHYVDGLPAASYESDTWNNSSQAQPSGNIMYVNPYISLLNDVRLYDHVLSPKEIKELSKGLVAHYPLNNNGWSNPNEIANGMPYNGVTGYNVAGGGNGWGTPTLVANSVSPSGYVVRSTYTGTGGHSGGIHKQPYNYAGLENGATYTFSVWARASKSIPANIYNEMFTTKTPAMPVTITTEWKHFVVSGPVDTSATYHSDIIYATGTDVTTNMWIEIYDLKLEKGNKATPWTPHTTDTQYTNIGYNTTRVNDISGYGNHGTVSSTAPIIDSDSPKYDCCMQFNGSSNFIMCGRGAMVTDAITYTAWAYSSDWSTAYGKKVISCTESGGWSFYLLNNNKLGADIGTGTSSNTYKSIQSTGTITGSGWHMFTVSYNGLNIKVYIDGVLSNTSAAYTTKTPIYYNTTNGIFIGAESGGNTTTPAGDYFNGKISDVRIYSTALSDADVKELYNTSASIANNGTMMACEFIEQ